MIARAWPAALAAAALGCSRAPAAPALEITIERPRALRCGTPGLDNVCRGDIAHVIARGARTLVVYEVPEYADVERLGLVCPGDLRCVAAGDGWAALYHADTAGRVRIVTFDRAIEPTTSVDDDARRARAAGASVHVQSLDVRL